MLAKNYYDESHKVEGKEFLLTEKLDGMRSVAIHQDGKVKFFSRSGQSILGLNEIESEILMLPEGVYDGELLIKNEEQHKDRDVLQETLKISRKDGIKTGLNFWLFDSLPNNEFQDGKSKKRYTDRRLDLNYLFDNNVTGVEENTRPQYKHVKLLPVIYAGKDITVIPTLLLKLEEEGKEGMMLNLDVPYVAKRTDGLLKIKTMQTFDEYCVGVFEGEGKYKGKLGGINVDYKGYPLKTGSGFTDEQREFYWNNPNEIIGRLVEVQYFRESKNDKGGLSVSFPIFKGIRNDKSEVSYH
jgi:DNA ligase-1